MLSCVAIAWLSRIWRVSFAVWLELISSLAASNEIHRPV